MDDILVESFERIIDDLQAQKAILREALEKIDNQKEHEIVDRAHGFTFSHGCNSGFNAALVLCKKIAETALEKIKEMEQSYEEK